VHELLAHLRHDQGELVTPTIESIRSPSIASAAGGALFLRANFILGESGMDMEPLMEP
jgi:hypothetical protein